MSQSVNILQAEIRSFIKKYYFDKTVKGLLLWFLVLLTALIFSIVVVGVFELSITLRTVFFYTLLFFTSSTFILWVGIPLSKYFFLGKIISDDKAALLIGNYFPEIQDKLLNVLQLNKEAEHQNNALLLASVQQKSEEVSKFSFTDAVNLKENLKRARIPFFISIGCILVFLLWPDFVKNSAKQLYYYNTQPTQNAPFAFNLTTDSLNVVEGKDITIYADLDGSKIPNQAFMEHSGASFTMKKEKQNQFSYTFKNVKEDITFNLEALGYTSRSFTISVLPSPKITRFTVSVDYPDHTGIEDAQFNNLGDLSIPEGSCVSWKLQTNAVDDVVFVMNDSMYTAQNSLYNYDIQSCFNVNTPYQVIYGNNVVGAFYDTIPYSIETIKDNYPSIDVIKEEDTTSQFRTFFTGISSDDYGINGVRFVYKSSSSPEWQSESISSKGSKTSKKFYHAIDIRNFNLEKGEDLTYYFQVFDNDGINGSKSTKSIVYTYKVPSLEDLTKQREEQTNQTKESLSDLQKKSEKIKKEIKEFRKNLMNKSSTDWKDKQKLEHIINDKQSLQEQLEEMLKDQQKNNEFKNEFNEYSEEILNKEKAIEELMENLMDEEMKKLLDELNKMMEEQMNKDQLDELLQKSEMKEEDLNKELDRSLELLKNLEIEQLLEETKDKLDALKDKQEKLAEETKDKAKSDEELKKEQEKLNDEFDKIKKDLEKINKKNEELERPKDLDELKEQQDAVDQEQQDAQENLDDGKNKKASESQKKAAEEMEKMSDQMAQMKSNSSAKQDKEDMEALRQLLENIVDLSVSQENLMDEFLSTDPNNPKYAEFTHQQRDLIDDAKMVEDSLFALSKRVVQLSSFINKEISEINMNLEKTVTEMQDRNTANLVKRQQYVMKGYNQLALMLSEVLEQMQKQQSMKMPGKGMCENPGGSSPNPSPGKMSMEQMKEQLKKQLEDMKKGKNPGGKKEGDSEGNGEGKPGDNPNGKGKNGIGKKEMVKMIQEQNAIRQAMEEMKSKSGGNKMGQELQKMIDDINKNKKDLLDENFEELIQRQQDILTRLLENENALREREFDNKRKSEEGKVKENGNPNSFLEYKKQKEKEIELLRTVPPSFKRYYREKANAYVNTITDG